MSAKDTDWFAYRSAQTPSRCQHGAAQQTRIHRMWLSPTLWLLRGAQDPIPSRTRPSNPSAPMVLSLKAWESRSLQGLPKPHASQNVEIKNPPPETAGGFRFPKTKTQNHKCASDKSRPHGRLQPLLWPLLYRPVVLAFRGLRP